jgi:secreted trypsin-like serine protease
VVRENGRFVLAGIVSGGKGCGRPLTSGIYMNAARYLNWITTAMDTDNALFSYFHRRR